MPIYRRRGTDHIGFLGTKLRDLLGFSTLAAELIQNADDAKDQYGNLAATSMEFNVRDDALIVDNDGIFTDCHNLDAFECPWKLDPSRNRMCDFHRFQNVASGDKREEVDTTGAFGIGFTAVYQITDQPTLISANRHWTIYEDQPENKRIVECQGCENCRDAKLPGTRFVLPWATDPNSTMRRKLRVDGVTLSARDELQAELLRSLPPAMLFLKKLERIAVRRNGELVCSFERIVDRDSLIVTDGKSVTIWHILRSTFASVADVLRQRHPGKIEDKRSSDVAIAIPADLSHDGLFCAFLPTRQRTGLPFHLNADFFPKSDRKAIVLESDYQSEWNRAAIEAAGSALAENLDWLREKVGHARFWRIAQDIWKLGTEGEGGAKEKSLGQFWECLSRVLGKKSVVYTSDDEWTTADKALFLEQQDEVRVTPILSALRCKIVHKDLRFAQNLLTSKTVGIRFLDASHLAAAIRDAGLVSRTEIASLPLCLQSNTAMGILWEEVYILLEQLKRRFKADERERIIAELSQCAIAPARDGAFWPCSMVYQADERTIQLFGSFLPNTPFLAEIDERAGALQQLCPMFDAPTAIAKLGELNDSEIKKSVESGQVDLKALILWFQHHQHQILDSPGTKRELAALPIFPSAQGPRRLTELSLTGDFKDPLGLAEVVNLEAIPGRKDFLRDLGAKELTFEHYAAEHVPRAFQGEEVAPDRRRAAIRLLADELGRLVDNYEIRDALASVASVECEDGSFRLPKDVYFSSPVIEEVLGDLANIALVPDEHQQATADFYGWLGVAVQPRLDAVIQRLSDLTDRPPNPDAIAAVRVLFGHLGDRFGIEEIEGEVAILKTRRWLPSRGVSDRWFRPDELDAYFSFSAPLFESQAQFLDAPQAEQQRNTSFLEFLGLRTKPDENRVVAHLLHCAETGKLVTKDIYRWLNEHSEHRAIGRLKGQPCLLMPDETFVRPDDVFWQPHSFGRFRFQLGADLRRYNDLFKKLGVDESPNHGDAIEVINELAAEYGNVKKAVDGEVRAVLMACWRMLEEALLKEDIDADALTSMATTRSICAANDLLNPPRWMYFDDRAGLAAKFEGFLENNVIQRPQGAWQAMAAAGVRPLSSAVESHLAEPGDPVEDDEILRRFDERRDLIARVLEFHEPGSADNVTRMATVRCCSAAELVVVYSVKLEQRQRQSRPEKVQAHFIRDDSTLYFVRTAGRPPWPDLARQMAAIMCPDVEPGKLAPVLTNVMGEETVDEASEILDRWDIPPLDTASAEAEISSSTIEDLGGVVDISLDEGSNLDDQNVDENPPEGSGPQTTDQAIQRLLGGAGPSPMPAGAGGSHAPGAGPGTGQFGTGQPGTGPSFAGSGDGHPAGTRPKAPRPGYSVLYSYVMPDRPDDDSPTDDEAHARRSKVDQAGVDRVEQFEESQERRPKIMAPNHPGYDVESFNGDEEVERYIEVKSLSGGWNGADARLTKTQFKKAMELRDRYWLYVVERADQDDFCIHCIQDPAGKANRFMFDPGWKQVAEETSENSYPGDDVQ